MEIVKAGERLVGLGPNQSGDATLYTSSTAYQCPQCGCSSPFDIRGKTTRVDLTEPFEAATGHLQPYEEDYCDFDCSGCGVHIRCVYALEEIRMAQYQYYPVTLYVSPSTGRPSVESNKKKSSAPKGCIYGVLAVGVLTVLCILVL